MSDSTERSGARNSDGTAHGPGMRFFAELTGQDVDEAAHDPQRTLARGLGALAHELGAIARDEVAADPARQQQAADRARSLRERLKRHQERDSDAGAATQAAKARFQGRLETALRETVAHLQTLHDEVVERGDDRDHGRGATGTGRTPR